MRSSFCSETGCADGVNPYGGLIQAANGELYGTTNQGGTNCNPNGCGTIFQITPGGTLTTLYRSCAVSGCADGQNPQAGLIQATDRNLYGTTNGGGIGEGTVFQITLGGKLKTLHDFCSQSGCTDGFLPRTALVQDTNGGLYGTTADGGNSGAGTIFSLSVGLSPFVKTHPASGMVGAVVDILGTDLKGATGLSSNP